MTTKRKTWHVTVGLRAQAHRTTTRQIIATPNRVTTTTTMTMTTMTTRARPPRNGKRAMPTLQHHNNKHNARVLTTQRRQHGQICTHAMTIVASVVTPRIIGPHVALGPRNKPKAAKCVLSANQQHTKHTTAQNITRHNQHPRLAHAEAPCHL